MYTDDSIDYKNLLFNLFYVWKNTASFYFDFTFSYRWKKRENLISSMSQFYSMYGHYDLIFFFLLRKRTSNESVWPKRYYKKPPHSRECLLFVNTRTCSMSRDLKLSLNCDGVYSLFLSTMSGFRLSGTSYCPTSYRSLCLTLTYSLSVSEDMEE